VKKTKKAVPVIEATLPQAEIDAALAKINATVTRVALRRIKWEIQQQYLKGRGKPPIGTIITDLAMKHLKPAPNENAAVNEIDSIDDETLSANGRG